MRRMAAAVVLSVTCSAGCGGPGVQGWVDNLVWSPDGQRATLVIGGDLYLTDRDGRLSPVLAHDVDVATWLADSRRLVLARSRRVNTFAEISAAVGAERTNVIIAEAERLWLLLHAPEWPNPDDDPSVDWLWNTPDIEAMTTYLRERYRDDPFLAEANRAGEDLELRQAELHVLVVARVTDDALEFGPAIYEDLPSIVEVRPAPGGRAVAFVVGAQGLFAPKNLSTYVVSADGSQLAKRLSTATAAFPDWTPDGRSLIYLDALRHEDPPVGTLGCLVTQRVYAGDRLDVGEASCTAIVLFRRGDRIRSLRDGRVLVQTLTASFPKPEGDAVERLVIVSGGGEAAQVEAFPAEGLGREPFASFDVSADRSRVSIVTTKGQIAVLSLDDNRRQVLPLGFERDSAYPSGDCPRIVWSGSDAIVYLRRVGARDEFILRRGDEETVLSRRWPDALLPPPNN